MTTFFRSLVPILPLGLWMHGCATLPAVTDNRCGNGVLETEAGEDCDGGTACGLPGTAQACRSLCVTDSDCGDSDCGVDGICRQPSGAFELVEVLAVNGTRDMMIAELDGDGCDEMILTEARGSEVVAFESREAGFCRAAERDFTPGGVPDGVAPLFPVPTPTQLTERIGGEVAFVGEGLASQGIYVVETSEGAELTSTIFGTLPLSLTDARSVRFPLGGRDVSLFVGRNVLNMGRTVLINDPRQPGLPLNAAFDLGGEVPVVLAAVEPELEADCVRVLYGRTGQSGLSVSEVCPGTPPPMPPMMGMGSPPSANSVATLTFPMGARLGDTAGLYIVDLDGDGRRDDIVVSAEVNDMGEANIFIGYGLDDGTYGPDPMATTGPNSLTRDPENYGEPIRPNTFFAVGEFQGDAGMPEVVSLPCPPPDMSVGSPTCASVVRRCEAVVADLNGDGADDIVANEGAQSGLAIRLGGSDADLPVTYLDTRCPPRALTVADLDGDRITDVAFLDQTITGDDPTDALSVAYGRPQAVPEAPVIQGAYGGALTLVGGRFEPDAATDQIASLRLLPGPVPAGPESDEDTYSQYALIEGGTQRLALAPYLFPSSPDVMQPGEGVDSFDDVDILATVGGRFGLRETEGGQEVANGIAVITEGAGMTGDLTLWLLESSFDGIDLGPRPSEESLNCDSCQLVAIELDNDPTGTDELVLLGEEGATIYESSPLGFSVRTVVSGAPAFAATVSPAMGPDRYNARPIVEDVDNDGNDDIVAVDAAGNIVVFFGDGQGGLSVQRWLDAPSCTDDCRAPIALLELDGEPGPELAILAPPDGLLEPGAGAMGDDLRVTDWLRFYRVKDRALEAIQGDFDLKGAGEVPPDFNSDLLSLASGDVDGDGVDDLSLSISSSVVYVLRGEPVNE